VSARVLIVEDNPTNLDLITYLLRSLGYDISCETDGEAGLASALCGDFDLVLTDILMPGIDGLEFARRFKSDPRTAGTPLVAVTALAMTGDRERILSAGFDGYIAKPIDPRKFAGEIAAFLNAKPRG
jgi:CheY-like chemotaxis protein